MLTNEKRPKGVIDKRSLSRIILRFHIGINFQYTRNRDINVFFSQTPPIPWSSLLSLLPGTRISNLFHSVEQEKIIAFQARGEALDREYHAPCLLSYYAVDCPCEVAETKKIISLLRKWDSVDQVYIETGPLMPPAVHVAATHSNMAQGHLQASPSGINAASAWAMEGGNGKGQVKFVDIEQGWILDHESYHIKTIATTGMNHPEFRDHGAGVLGVLLMHGRKTALQGIVPAALGYPISQWRADGSFNTADAIMAAIAELDFGDIILLEAQVPDSPQSDKVWPPEIQEAVFDAIRLATALGITVIEPAGNGKRWFGRGNDLDKYADDHGKKIFDPSSPDFKDSGAVMVAGATSHVPHEKIGYSNYGRRIDCFAWGENVLTAGSFPGSSRKSRDLYTGKFGGTSSAAAIIAGVAIAIQSMVEANHGFRFSPGEMRTILRNDMLGTASANGRIVDKIGAIPDLKKIKEYIDKNARELKEWNTVGIERQESSRWALAGDK